MFRINGSNKCLHAFEIQIVCLNDQARAVARALIGGGGGGSDDDDDKLYLTTLTLSAEAGFHNGRVKKTLTEFYK